MGVGLLDQFEFASLHFPHEIIQGSPAVFGDFDTETEGGPDRLEVGLGGDLDMTV